MSDKKIKDNVDVEFELENATDIENLKVVKGKENNKKKKVIRMSNRDKDKKPNIPLKNYTLGGVVSLSVAVVAYLILALLMAWTIKERGHAGVMAGVLMLADWIVSIVGFSIGIKSFTEGKNKFLKYSYIGTISNAIIMVGMFLVYISYI